MTARAGAPVEPSAYVERGLIALGLALFMNLALGWVLLWLGIPGSTGLFQYGPIALWTTAGVTGATAVYYLLTRWSDAPDRSFRILAGAVLVLSFLPNLGQALFADDVTNTEAASLALLHLPPAVICLVVLTGWLFDAVE